MAHMLGSGNTESPPPVVRLSTLPGEALAGAWTGILTHTGLRLFCSCPNVATPCGQTSEKVIVLSPACSLLWIEWL